MRALPLVACQGGAAPDIVPRDAGRVVLDEDPRPRRRVGGTDQRRRRARSGRGRAGACNDLARLGRDLGPGSVRHGARLMGFPPNGSPCGRRRTTRPATRRWRMLSSPGPRIAAAHRRSRRRHRRGLARPSPRLPDAAWTICDWDEGCWPTPPRRPAGSIWRAIWRRPSTRSGSRNRLRLSGPCVQALAHPPVQALEASGAALYALLTYDGRGMGFAPPHEAEALAAFHADMRRDKGFGPALGPDAPAAALDLAAKAGRAAQSAPSDWRIAPDH